VVALQAPPPDLLDGGRAVLLAARSGGFPFTQAMWVYDPEVRDWNLTILTPLIGGSPEPRSERQLGHPVFPSTAASRAYWRFVQLGTSDILPMARIVLLSPDDYFVVLLRELPNWKVYIYEDVAGTES